MTDPATVLAAAGGGAPTVGPLRAGLVVLLVAVGGFFLLVGTVGLLRLPTVYNRLHATSKATTLGAASVFLAGFVFFGPGGAGLTCLLGIGFLFLTAPTGGHVISRAAHRMGIDFSGSAAWPLGPSEADREDSDD
ncbi:MAG: multicomponent Na+:H+ antiporter subunit G [Salinirussus sp.]|jgi:multicomponent Na+:H+ antiporter subunit G